MKRTSKKQQGTWPGGAMARARERGTRRQTAKRAAEGDRIGPRIIRAELETLVREIGAGDASPGRLAKFLVDRGQALELALIALEIDLRVSKPGAPVGDLLASAGRNVVRAIEAGIDVPPED